MIHTFMPTPCLYTLSFNTVSCVRHFFFFLQVIYFTLGALLLLEQKKNPFSFLTTAGEDELRLFLLNHSRNSR